MVEPLSRRNVLAAGGALLATLSLEAPARAQPRSRRPNILFIMADDLGYADLSCYGRRDYATPQLDRLAAQGLRFTTAYANSPVCSATRTALMTGRYQYRLPVGLEEPLATRDVGLPPDHPTLPSLLRAAGYATALLGKWHLGRLPAYGPLQSGYEHFWGFRGGTVDYFTHSFAGTPDLWDGDAPIEQAGYLTDLLADRAIATLEEFERAGRPFFLSLHFNAPHWPWEGPDDRTEAERVSAAGTAQAMQHFDGGSQRIYAAMVTRLDAQIGRVLAALDRLDAGRETIVIFTSDNGGERFSDNWPFTGRKTELLEGGVRVPAIVRWPGRVAEGSRSDAQIMTMDWVPTLLAAAGAAPAPDYPPDGIELSAALAGGTLPERTLFWRYKNAAQEACRRGDWKYLRIAGNSFLFDVRNDPMERANLKTIHPEIFAALQAAWNAWNATMLPIDPDSFSGGISGDELADRPGSAPPERR